MYAGGQGGCSQYVVRASARLSVIGGLNRTVTFGCRGSALATASILLLVAKPTSWLSFLLSSTTESLVFGQVP